MWENTDQNNSKYWYFLRIVMVAFRFQTLISATSDSKEIMQCKYQS